MKELFLLAVRFNGGKTRGAQAALARAMGTSAANVNRYLKGLVRPGEDALLQMAGLFQVPPEYLRSLWTAKPARAGIPVFSLRVITRDQFILQEQPETLLPFPPPCPGAFAVRAETDTLDGLPPGEYVILLPNKTPQNGQITLVRLKTGRCVLRRFYARPAGWELRTDRSAFAPLTLTPRQATILGTAYFAARPLPPKQ